MTGLDTNVLVRYLTQDDPAQALKATQVIEDAAEQGELLYITSIVLCETVWVLDAAYGHSKQEIQAVLERILRTAQFRFDHKDQLWRALQDYREGHADFSDYLIGHLGAHNGCQETVTFDKALRNHASFRLL
jgi:predicted nucleic-acid-binding protein